MELKDVKALQDMGFSLEEIKAVYFTEPAPETSGEKPAAPLDPKLKPDQAQPKISEKDEHLEESKKNASLIESLTAKIDELKSSLYKANSREKLAEGPKADTLEDIVKTIIGG